MPTVIARGSSVDREELTAVILDDPADLLVFGQGIGLAREGAFRQFDCDYWPQTPDRPSRVESLILDHDFIRGLTELDSLVQAIEQLEVPERLMSLSALAEQAIDALDRQEESVEAWARLITDDVAGAND